MGAFDDIILDLWKTLGLSAPPPAGRTAELVIDDIEIRLTDHGRHLRVRAIAGPLAAAEPQRGAQITTALRLALGSLKRQPVVIHIKQDQNRQMIFVEQKISYKKGHTLQIQKQLSHITGICSIIINQDQEAHSLAHGAVTFDYDHENPMENEVVFRI